MNGWGIALATFIVFTMVWGGYTVGERHGKETAWIDLERDEARLRRLDEEAAAWRAENPPVAEPDYDQCVDLLNSWNARPPGGPDRF